MQTLYRVMGPGDKPLDPMSFDEFARAVHNAHALRLQLRGGSSRPIPEPPEYTLEWARRHLDAYATEHPDARGLWIQEVVTRQVE